MKRNVTTEEKLINILGCINRDDSLYCVSRTEANHFELQCKKDGRSIIPIMTFVNDIIYLKAKRNNLSQTSIFDFDTILGTFEENWGPYRKKIVLTPTDSCIRRVDIEIQGLDVPNASIFSEEMVDVVIDTPNINFVRNA